ncbi:MAG: Ribosomal protein S12 methylthiotransferase RimO [Candidatus Omnitrophica bacterium]|nr:Ribosomal protein S12 methylthiotransferase RimO [Candidatus Omnitrophota bacterium]
MTASATAPDPLAAGRPTRVALVSLGCARTLVDSEVALGSLKGHGYQIVRDVKDADVAIVNTCGFIEEAKVESVETILTLCERKKKGRLGAVVVLGCLAQRYGGELREELAEVDGIVGTDSFGALAEVLEPLRAKHARVYDVRPRPTYLLDEKTPRVALTPPHYAYVKISEGCINACSYCVIPKMKGAHRSRTVESVVSEIEGLCAERSLSEVLLIGQDTAAFGYDRSRRFELPELLRAVDRSGRVPWVRLLYAHPGHINDEMIAALAEGRSLCKYVDFPIEHSHDAMLRRMNRGVDRRTMMDNILKLRRAMPELTLRTTVIVGFPGETEEEFEDLLQCMKEVRFEKLGAFIYSPEEGARSVSLPDPIDPALKRERYEAVMELQFSISAEINAAKIGRKMRVLIDTKDKRSGRYLGRTEGDAPEVDGQVKVTSKKELRPGEFVDVTITGADEHDLRAETLS